MLNPETEKLPAKFLDSLRALFDEPDFERIANTFTERRPTTFRANLLKITSTALAEALSEQGFETQQVPWCDYAFILRNKSLRDLQETPEYEQGKLYVQNLSSMVPPLILEAKPGENVLDMTAAPGGKSMQIAMMMRGEGKLIANDNSKVRFFKLKANVERQGVKNIELSLKYGESFGKYFQGHFDRILLDAPCSTEGKFYTSKPSSYKYWRPAKTKEMARKQKRLLYAAFESLKKGGTLVYSTCTFSPHENEWILSWAHRKFGDAFSVEQINLPFENFTEGLTSYRGKDLHPSIKNARRILPTETMEPFFVAKIKRL